MQWGLDLILIVMLAGTLVQALRLERALGVLKRDRAALEQLVSGFNESTRHAEQSIERLRSAADGAGRQIARQIDAAASLKDDLVFLTDRGDKAADRLDALVRLVRPLVADSATQAPPVQTPPIQAPPAPTAPVLSSPVLSSPALSSPALSSPVLGSPVLGSPVLGSPVLSSRLADSGKIMRADDVQRPRPPSKAELDLVRVLRLGR